MSETPLLFTDLLSPTSLAKYQKKKENINAPFVEENNVIPIKTWTTGSPLDKKRFFKDDLHDIKEGDGMETYYAKAFGDPTDEEANAEDDEEDGDDEAENTQQDDDDDEEEATDHKFEDEDGELIREVPDYMLSTAEYEEEGMEEYLNENDFDGAQYTENEEEEEEEEGDDDEEDDNENQGNYEEEEEEEAYGDDYNDDEEEEYENDQDHDDDDNDPKQPQQKKEQTGMFSDLIGLINSYEEMKEEVIRESRTFKNSKSGEVIPSPAKHEDFSAEDLMRLEQDGEGDDEDTTSIVNEYKDLLEYLASPRNNNDDQLTNEDTNHLFDNDFDVFPSAAMTTKLTKKVKSKPSGAKSNKGKEQNIMTKTKKTLQPSAKNNNFFYYPSAGSAAEEKKLNENYRYQSSSVEEGNDDDYEENDPALLEMVKVSKAALKQIMTNNDENHQNQQKKKKSTKKPQKDHKKFYNLEPKIVKKSHPLIKKQGADKAKLLAAQKRHRDMLADIVNKRKAEEEELLDLAAKAQEKRKKFKEALLEKAIKAKKEQEENIVEEVEVIKPPPKQAVFATQPSSNAAPPRYLQSIVTNRKSPQEIIADADELAKQEEEKRERIASIRRKFKEQHKRLLISLMLKKKEEELVEEQQQILEQIAKEKRKKKMMKMLSEKTPEKNLLIVPNSKEIEEEDKPSVKKAVLIHHQSQSLSNIPSEMTNDVQQVTARVAAGSAIQAIRQRSHSVSETSTTQTNKQKKPQQKPSKQSIEEGHDVNESESDTDGPVVVTKLEENEENPEEIQKKLELLEAKRQFSLQQSKKIAAYLNALTEQKKKEEIEKKKKEDRQKKRMILLSQRLLKEATERKLMIAEDKPIYQSTNSKECGRDWGRERKEKEITPEMAEIIAARLNKRSSISNNTTEGDREANSAPAAGSKAVKVKVDRQRVINNKDSSEDDNHNETTAAVKHTNPPIPTIVPTNIIYRDFNDWKRKNNVPIDAKVFCMTGWYPCVKQALIDRGWHFNPDPTSPYCHLKWTLRSIDINQDSLQPWQLTNHYCKNVAITTKAGLIKSLQSLIWMANVDIHDIIPRAYDVTTQDDLVSFLDDYRNQKAESILKKLYYQVTGLETILFDNPNEYRPLSSAVSAGRGGGDASPIFERKKQSPTTKEDSEVDGEGEDAVEEESEKREKPEKIQIAPLTITQSLDEMDQESKPIPTSTTFDLNDFALPSIPPLPDSVHALNPFPEIEINGAIFEITCQLLEHQMKPYNIGSRKTRRSRRRGQETGRKSSNQSEEEESRSTRAAKHNDSDEEEGTEDEQEEEDDDINVCDYDYCPSGYHEINIKNNNTHNLPNNNNNYSTGIHPYINYPKSVINGIKLVSDLHWEVIDNYSIYQSIPSLPFDAPEPLDGFLRK